MKSVIKIGRQVGRQIPKPVTLPPESPQDYWIRTEFLGGKQSVFRFYGTQAEASRRAEAASKCHHAVSSVAYGANPTEITDLIIMLRPKPRKMK